MHIDTQNEIREASMKYISNLFKIPLESFDKNYKFGEDLKAKPNPFSEGEFDDLIFDIEYVADDETLNDFRSNKIKITTVEDFSNYMIKCYDKKRREVRRVLKLNLGKRRLFLFYLRHILNKGISRKFFYFIKNTIYTKKKYF